MHLLLWISDGQSPTAVTYKRKTIRIGIIFYLKSEIVIERAENIMATGVKMKDSCHIVCAEMMNCDYLLTTDKRMLKYWRSSVKLLNPIEFVDLLNGGKENDA